MDTIKKRRFCRACGGKVKKPCEIKDTPVTPDLTLILKRYIPEFNIEVDNPCFCEDCFTTLYAFHNFKKQCWRTEENVRLHRRKHPEIEIVNLFEVFAPDKGKSNSISNATENNTCKLCNRVLYNKGSLQRHMKHYHNRERYQCTKCSRSFVLKDVYKNHIALHEKSNSDRYACKQCNFVYLRAASLKAHNLCKHMSGAHKQYWCEVCGKKFAVKSSLLGHMQEHEKRNEKTIDDVHQNAKKYKCPLCDYAIDKKAEMQKHLLVKHNQKDKTKIQCKLCHRLLGKDSFAAHKRLFHGRARYNCTKCNREFPIKRTYDEHLKYHKKPNSNQHSCKICNFVYHSAAALEKHRIAKHESDDEKPYQCEVCSMRFVEKSVLEKHIPTHVTGLKSKCSLCDYTAKHISTIRKHFKVKHKESTFVCKDVISLMSNDY